MALIKNICLILFSFTLFNVYGQSSGTLKGTVSAAENGEALIGVNVICTSQKGTTTDENGYYEIKLRPGNYKVIYKYIGYQQEIIDEVVISKNEEITVNVKLKEDEEILDEVVFTASKFGKRITKETVSIEMVKAKRIEQTAPADVAKAMDIIPGVFVMDNQLNIRGGTGFAYGAGAKTQMVVDGLTLISADRGDNKFNLVPLETLERLEVIKGAASVLYGSSALNGVVHARSIWPTKDKPTAKIVSWAGRYSNPKNNLLNSITFQDVNGQDSIVNYTLAWWDENKNPIFGGLYGNFAARLGKEKKLDLVLGAAGIADRSHLEIQKNDFLRGNIKMRYRANEKLNFGVSANASVVEEGLNLLRVDSTFYSPFTIGADSASDINDYIQTYIDPFITFFDGKNNKHKFFGRYYKVRSWYDRAASGNRFGGNAVINTAEYQFYGKLKEIAELTTGISYMNFNVEDSSLVYTSGSTLAPYLHTDIYPTENLTLSAGLRWETFNITGLLGANIPVFKGGINYEFSDDNSIRASFGQGFRFPSPAERFLDFPLGPIAFFGNQDLEPEKGWNAEIGYKHIFKIQDWKLNTDISIFVTEYKNLVESVFDLYLSDSIINTFANFNDTLDFLTANNSADYLGFKFLNTGEARILGTELSLNANGKIGATELQLLGGYTYNFPGNLNDNPELKKWGTFLNQVINPDLSATAISKNLLKYRFRHLFKFDAQAKYKNFFAGFSTNYYSFLDRIDEIFVGQAGGLTDLIEAAYINLNINDQIFIPSQGGELIPGVTHYRNNRNGKGDWIIGARMGYAPTENITLTAIGKNILNRKYTIRPAKMEAPANYTLQLKLEF